MVGYCLQKAHSSTSWLALFAGVATMLALGLRWINKQYIGTYVVAGIVVLIAAQFTFDIFGNLVDASGHSATYEGRGHLWQTLLETDTNPIIGVGFESYWLGERLQKLWSIPEFWWRPNEAHNGYLEIYLNLGILGLASLAAMLVEVFRKCKVDLMSDFEWGRFRSGCLVTIMAYNWTESAYKGLHIVFLLVFFVAVNYSSLRELAAKEAMGITDAPEEGELAFDEAGIAESARDQ